MNADEAQGRKWILSGLRPTSKKSEKQIPRGLKPARDDKNKGLLRHSLSCALSKRDPK